MTSTAPSSDVAVRWVSTTTHAITVLDSLQQTGLDRCQELMPVLLRKVVAQSALPLMRLCVTNQDIRSYPKHVNQP